ncbi:MAG: type II toxin-antitoxin system VapC family toxin [Myxococcota bacterium]
MIDAPRLAYVDTSCLVAVAFEEPGHDALRARLQGYSSLVAGGLVEAELCSALARENRGATAAHLFPSVRWFGVPARLTAELERVFEAGYLRGADAWHLAAALWFCDTPPSLAFCTLDKAQAAVARHLGFAVPTAAELER